MQEGPGDEAADMTAPRSPETPPERFDTAGEGQAPAGTASALLNKFLKNFKINKTKAKDCSRRNASYSVCISNWYKSDKKLKNGPKIVLFLFRMKQVVVVHLHEILKISN